MKQDRQFWQELFKIRQHLHRIAFAGFQCFSEFFRADVTIFILIHILNFKPQC